MRAEIAELLGEGRVDEAAERYRTLRDDHKDKPAAATLSRDALFRIGSHFVTEGLQKDAAEAFERFVATFPTDREAPQAMILLGRLYANDLDDRERAIAHLRKACERLPDGDFRAMAQAELEAMGESLTDEESEDTATNEKAE